MNRTQAIKFLESHPQEPDVYIVELLPRTNSERDFVLLQRKNAYIRTIVCGGRSIGEILLKITENIGIPAFSKGSLRLHKIKCNLSRKQPFPVPDNEDQICTCIIQTCSNRNLNNTQQESIVISDLLHTPAEPIRLYYEFELVNSTQNKQLPLISPAVNHVQQTHQVQKQFNEVPKSRHIQQVDNSEFVPFSNVDTTKVTNPRIPNDIAQKTRHQMFASQNTVDDVIKQVEKSANNIDLSIRKASLEKITDRPNSAIPSKPKSTIVYPFDRPHQIYK